MVSLAMILHDHGSLGKILARSCQDLGKHTHASWQACQDSCHWVVTDDPPKSHRWTTEVTSAAFAVATGGNILTLQVVTESSTGGQRWTLINTPLATDGSTDDKSVSSPDWQPPSLILGPILSECSDYRSYSIRKMFIDLFTPKHSGFRPYSIKNAFRYFIRKKNNFGTYSTAIH